MLANQFVKKSEMVNYLQMEKYIEEIIAFLGEISFDIYPELVEIGDFCPFLKEEQSTKENNLIQGLSNSFKESETLKAESNLMQDICNSNYIDLNHFSETKDKNKIKTDNFQNWNAQDRYN